MRNLVVSVLTVAVVAGIALFAPGLLPEVLRPALTGPVAAPPAPPAASPGSAPLRQVREGEGSFRFSAVQPDDDQVPVAYPSCRPIPFVVNLEGAPDPEPDLRMVLDAAARVGEATGLRLEYRGASEDRPRWDEPDRRLDPGTLADPPPVLVSWAEESEVPQLAGDVAGIAGSVLVREDGRARYLTGEVTLDRDTFAGLRDRRDGDSVAAAITLHEMAHLVGLDHVDDPRELMYTTTTDQRDFGTGDLEGLRLLGRGPCP